MANLSKVLISAVEGNAQWLDGGAMFGNAPRALWERWAKPDSLGRIRLACRAMLVEMDDIKILCETGIGAYMEPALAQRYGVEGREHRLLESLKTLGLSPDDIDYVILSHLHFDHAGGLLPSYEERQQGNSGLLFQKARFVVGKEAWERSVHPHARDRASFIPELTKLLVESGRLDLVSGPHIPGLDPARIQVRFSSGHTPGQMHTLVKGDRETFYFAGDLVPGKAWVHLPVTMGYDRFAEQVIDEKQALYKEAVPGGWHLFFTHDTDLAAARVQQDDKGRYGTFEELSSPQRYVI